MIMEKILDQNAEKQCVQAQMEWRQMCHKDIGACPIGQNA